MQPDAITTHAIHQILRAIRSARPLRDSPLLHLSAVTEALEAEHLADTPTARAAFLARWLEDLAWRQLEHLRGSGVPVDRPRPVLTPEAALAALRADFRGRGADREAWAVLYHHYLASSSFTLREIAAAVGLGYNTVLRRAERGYELFAELLRERERSAGAAVTVGRNIPQPLTRFIGRETELGAIRALLAEHRLVTLTGPGGIGKSRLAIHLARDLAADYPDGAWFAEVAALTNGDQVPQALLTTLGLREAPGLPPTRTLIDFLKARRALLIIDNCEHLVAACSALIGELLRSCEDLQVLATSRETLFVDGGAAWSVPPMALPPEAMAVTAGGLMHFDAPRLFGARAAAARPGFRLDDANAARVAGICAQLDGIPLAIELAAALTRYLALDELDARLVDRYALLKDGRHAARPGHETLRAAMDWSYDLLTEPERRLLQRLSVFSGGWMLEAAEGVCAGEGFDEREVLMLLAQLEAKSLVVVQVASGERRFRMLETVRQYALHRLVESGEEAVWRDAHARHFVAFARTAEIGINQRGEYDRLVRLDQEQPNFHSAFDWIVRTGDFEQGSRLAHCLNAYWGNRGGWREARQILLALLACDDPPSASQARADALIVAAACAYNLGDYPEARSLLEEALTILRVLDSPRDLGRAYNSLANVLSEGFNDLAGARDLLVETLSISRAVGDEHTESAALYNLGKICFRMGDQDLGFRYLEQSLVIDRRRGDLEGVAKCQIGLGLAYGYSSPGDFEAARSCFQEGIEIAREIGSPSLISTALINIGDLASREGDWSAAAKAFSEGVALCRESEHGRVFSFALRGLGMALVQLGEFGRARDVIGESLGMAVEQGRDRDIANSLNALASIEIALGNPYRAARLIGAATARLESDGLTRSVPVEAEVAETLARVADALGPEARDAAVAEGHAMAPAAAVAYALEGTPRAMA